MKLLVSLLVGMWCVGCATLAPAKTFEIDAGRTIKILGQVDGNIIRQANQLVTMSEVSKEPITLLINSPGGYVMPGLQFVSAMRVVQSRGVTIRCIVPMAAASMAFIIYNECDERYALSQAQLLWHGIAVGLMGSFKAKELAVILDDILRLGQNFDQLLMDKLELEPKQFYYYYDNDSWIPATKLLELSPHYLKIVDDIEGLTDQDIFSMLHRKTKSDGK